MKNDILLNTIILLFSIFSIPNISVKGGNARCLYMLSESEVYNFYYLKSDYEENK